MGLRSKLSKYRRWSSTSATQVNSTSTGPDVNASDKSDETVGLEPFGAGDTWDSEPSQHLAGSAAPIAGTEQSDLLKAAGSQYPRYLTELERRQTLSDRGDPLWKIDSQLRVACEPDFNHPHRGSFVPISSLQRIMTPEAVASVLLVSGIPMSDKSDGESLLVAKDLLGADNRPCYRQVLAILIMIGKVDEFVHFYRDGIDDSKLPLAHKGSIKDPSLHLQDRSPVECFKHWDSNSREQFNERQWEMLAQTFFNPRATDPEKKVPHFKISHRRPLPFTQLSGHNYDDIKRGQFADVIPFTIHDAHHDFPSFSSGTHCPQFALKRLKDMDGYESFYNEVNILTKLNKYNNEHLVKLLFTIEREKPEPGQSEFFLVFPLATCNLRQLWLRHDPYKGHQGLATYATWVGRQCLGLANALGMVHNRESEKTRNTQNEKKNPKPQYYGIHADIKPENLLCFGNWHDPQTRPTCELGLIQLADFGISSFHHTSTMADIYPRGHTRTYRAPETDLGQKISSSFDIWGLGCVFLEFLVWLVEGVPDFEGFSEERIKFANQSIQGIQQDTYYTLDVEPNKTTAKINPAVTEKVRRLHAHEHSTNFVHDFLDLIFNGMLVVEDGPTRHLVAAVDGKTPRKPETPKQATKARLKCDQIVERLSRMTAQGDRIAGYYTDCKPKPIDVKKLSSQEVTVRIPLAELQRLQRQLDRRERGGTKEASRRMT